MYYLYHIGNPQPAAFERYKNAIIRIAELAVETGSVLYPGNVSGLEHDKNKKISDINAKMINGYIRKEM